MLDPEKEFIIDAVAHAYNLDPSNYADVASAQPISELTYLIGGAGSPEPRYNVPHDVYISDWSPEDVANILFKETATDMAVAHTLPLYCFADGMCSVEKSAEFVRRWPQRFRAYAAIDPLRADWRDALARQVDLFQPIGLKVYPTSWNGSTISQWKMNDPSIAFPVYEAAMKAGINVVAVHKAVPLGPVVAEDAFNPGDLEGAAGSFPDLSFEIVHGGIAFSEETGWLMARFANIYINLEVSNIILERRPRTFGKMLMDLLKVGGMPMLDRLIWATGCSLAHPRPTIDAFCRYEIPDDLLQDAGLFGPLSQITDDHKRNIFANNYARIHKLDIEALKRGIVGDEFAEAREANPSPEPWSSIERWPAIQQGRVEEQELVAAE
jgi:predicted TIM-barrel fold metal-dependent hydrolase